MSSAPDLNWYEQELARIISVAKGESLLDEPVMTNCIALVESRYPLTKGGGIDWRSVPGHASVVRSEPNHIFELVRFVLDSASIKKDTHIVIVSDCLTDKAMKISIDRVHEVLLIIMDLPPAYWIGPEHWDWMIDLRAARAAFYGFAPF